MNIDVLVFSVKQHSYPWTQLAFQASQFSIASRVLNSMFASAGLLLWRFRLFAVCCSVDLIESVVAHNAKPGRAAHYVLRVSDLERSIDFYSQVMGMRVIRHEESPRACPITCNGKFGTPWSKTMIGYDSEDVSYALELTYNYGVQHYTPGTSFLTIEVGVTNVVLASKAAYDLGYVVEGQTSGHLNASVVGPDGYRYHLTQETHGSAVEPFKSVRLHVKDPQSAAKWYEDVLGMESILEGDGSVSLSFIGAKQPVLLRFIPSSASSHRVEQWEGRNAFSVPAEQVKSVYSRLSAESPERIVHDLQILDEALGKLYIAIISDPNGFEICLVSSETFDPAVRAAAVWKGPDWKKRSELALEYVSFIHDASPFKSEL